MKIISKLLNMSHVNNEKIKSLIIKLDEQKRLAYSCGLRKVHKAIDSIQSAIDNPSTRITREQFNYIQHDIDQIGCSGKNLSRVFPSLTMLSARLWLPRSLSLGPRPST